MIDIQSSIEKWRIRRELNEFYLRAFKDVLREGPAFEDLCRRCEVESAVPRSRLREIESLELTNRAAKYGIIIADLPPLRFGSPVWQKQAGCSYLSVEGERAVKQAIRIARAKRLKFWISIIGPLTGIIGALTGLIAVLRK